MRSISKLVDKGTKISVADLQDEINERQKFLDDRIPPILSYTVGYENTPPITHETRTEITKEMALLDMQIAWSKTTSGQDNQEIDPAWESAFKIGHDLGVKFERRQHQVDAVNKRHETNKTARIHCILKAEELWEGDPTARIGDIVDALTYDLNANDLYCPKPKTIRKWLKDAQKEGDLNIPPDASKSGAPLTSMK